MRAIKTNKQKNTPKLKLSTEKGFWTHTQITQDQECREHEVLPAALAGAATWDTTAGSVLTKHAHWATHALTHAMPMQAGWNSLGSGPRLLCFSWTYRTLCSYRNINSLIIMENKDFWYFPPSMPLVHIKLANPWPVLLDACFLKKCYLSCWLRLHKTRLINLGLGLGQKSQQSPRWP